jgi:hypothetical protein
MKSHLVLVFGVIGLIVFNTALGFGPRHVTIECPREAQVGAWNIGEWTGSGFVAAYLEGASIQEVGARSWLVCDYRPHPVPEMFYQLSRRSPESTPFCQVLLDRSGFRCSNLRQMPEWRGPRPEHRPFQ